jgi:hypothetical protein
LDRPKYRHIRRLDLHLSHHPIRCPPLCFAQRSLRYSLSSSLLRFDCLLPHFLLATAAELRTPAAVVAKQPKFTAGTMGSIVRVASFILAQSWLNLPSSFWLTF